MLDRDIDELAQALVRSAPFDPPEGEGEIVANEIRAKILATEDEDERELLFEDLKTAVAMTVYGGYNPKTVPNKVLKHCITHPVTGVFFHMDARRRVKNPNTAIRARCLECQGNDQVAVQQCQSVTCFLWPFRKGGNPLYGRLINADAEAEVEETEIDIAEMERIADEEEAARAAAREREL